MTPTLAPLAAAPLPDTTQMTNKEAADLTSEIRQGLVDLEPLVTRAYNGRAWLALGYHSWQQYINREFGAQLRLTADQRLKATKTYISAQMPTRAIAAATGVSQATASRAVRLIRNEAEPSQMTQYPMTIIGLDGKERTVKNVTPTPTTMPQLPAAVANEDLPLDSNNAPVTSPELALAMITSTANACRTMAKGRNLTTFPSPYFMTQLFTTYSRELTRLNSRKQAS